MEEKRPNPGFLTDPPDSKLLRDPIYGYISIPNHIFTEIIDQASFQRLRFIRQTSYEPLYSAALHNRFIHSIGVYYLGRIAFRSFYQCAVDCGWMNDGTQDWERLYHIFTCACLLHDVGHAPFSHSGEKFFEKDTPKPLERLIGEIHSLSFEEDANVRTRNRQAAAPHEIMSAYAALRVFPELFRDPEEKELFARCITGYLYTPEKSDISLSDDQTIKNCLISLLNSSIIDVDRLDYVIRDAYVSGFQNVSIDYQRLLNSISVVQKDGAYQLAYHKSALSIIESVIVAYDSEKKWIQSHPVVLYEHFLIQHSIEVVEQYITNILSPGFAGEDRLKSNEKSTLWVSDVFRRFHASFRRRVDRRSLGEGDIHEQAVHPLFSFESLSEDGNRINEEVKISLLSDDDIIYNIKNIPQCQDSLTQEYFSRMDRRHAIWKSEAEYRALFERTLGPDRLNELESYFAWIENYFNKNVSSPGNFLLPIIDQTFLDHCKKRRQELEKQVKKDPGQKDYASQLSMFSKIVPLLSQLKEYMSSRNLPFDLVVVTAKQFRSAFERQDIDQILVHFPKFKAAYYIRDVSSVLRAESGRERFFYLYYHRRKRDNGADIKIDALEFSSLLCGQLFRVC